MLINKDYPCNSSNYAVMTDKVNRYIVIHYVGALGSALDNARYYSNTPNIGASAHYFVGHASENGAVYQSVEDKDRAFHAGNKDMNMQSIGIEMCCHKSEDGTWYFDDITVENTIALVKELMSTYGIPIENVIRHYDVTGKNCPAPFVENPKAWEAFKNKLIEVDNMKSVPSDWAIEACNWAGGNGLIKGDENGDYKWQDNLTREQFAVILKRFYDIIK